ncbi:sodium/potassium/calcium exchanger 3-like [Aethina tumida]|uniref:sodium/potassium/calcium exchanger 3-like n=1 Tax=Aethina tumida TaxID=116153 RepID=UPI0021480C63|nr:sodium/potassium/calcium exchanger 3-like [Aethina tumida]
MNRVFIAVFIVCVSVPVELLESDPSINPGNNSTLVNQTAVTKTPLPIQENIRHRRFIPFARPNAKTQNISECTGSSDDFPYFFSDDVQRDGGFILFFLIGIYCFTFLAIICENYFIPCVELICEELNLSKDVAAATFMSTATSCPELFTNVISTFVTQSDLGIGTIVGSSMFNTLGVAALGGLAASKPIKIDGWPLTRDVIIYILSVTLLVSITWNNRVDWYEGLTLFILYFMYCVVLFNNNRITEFFKNKVKGEDKAYSVENYTTKWPRDEPIKISVISHRYNEEIRISTEMSEEPKKVEVEKEESSGLFDLPEGSILKKIFFYYVWPIKFLLGSIMPDPEKHPRLFPITFILCIICIGANSYLVSWMITLIGRVFNIPDAVLGLTFLAAGGCLPESISIVIMSRRGEGAMGVSNSMGANTMNILLSLGFPWFFKAILKGTGPDAYVEIESGSIQYTILALIAVSIILYATLYFNKFHMSKKTGIILLLVYIVCAILATLSEMVFFNTTAPCS